MLPPKNGLLDKRWLNLNGTGFIDVLIDSPGSQIVSGGLSNPHMAGNRAIFCNVRAQSFGVLQIFRNGRASDSNDQENFCIALTPSSNDREIF